MNGWYNPCMWLTNIFFLNGFWAGLGINLGIAIIFSAIGIFTAKPIYDKVVRKILEKGGDKFLQKSKEDGLSADVAMFRHGFTQIVRNKTFAYFYLGIAIATPVMVFFCDRLVTLVGESSVGGKISFGASTLVIVEYESDSHKFIARKPGNVIVTYEVETCKGQTLSATCQINIMKYVENIQFTPDEEIEGNRLDISSSSYNLKENLTFTPTEYNDEISFSCVSDIASVDKNGYVIFNNYGEVQVTISAKGKDGGNSVSLIVTLNFVETDNGEKKPIIVDDTFNEDEIIELRLESEHIKQTVNLSVAEGCESPSYQVIEGDENITFENNVVTPIKEGFAKIKVQATKDGEPFEKTVQIYVDQLCTDFEFEKPDWEFYKIPTITDPSGYMVKLKGLTTNLLESTTKELKVDFVSGIIKCLIKSIVYKDDGNYELFFNTFAPYREGTYVFKIGVYYKADTNISGIEAGTLAGVEKEFSFTIAEPHLESVEITHNDYSVVDGQTFTIDDIGNTIKFYIKNQQFAPVGFTFLSKGIVVDGIGETFETPIVEEVKGGETILGFNVTLKSKLSTPLKPAELTFKYNDTNHVKQIVLKTIKIISNALGNEIKLSANGLNLEKGNTYNVSTGKINLIASFADIEGIQVTEKQINWQSGSNSGIINVGESTPITIDLNSPSISLTSKKASFTFNITNVSSFEDFGLKILLNGSEISTIDSVKDTQSTSISLPKSQVQVSLEINLQNLISTFTDDEFEAMFQVSTNPESFDKQTSGDSRRFILTSPNEITSGESITISHNGINFVINIARTDVARIEFIDHYTTDGISTNGTGVYRGAQQVRLFAKHSFYDGKEVDYYKMKIYVIGTVENIEWQLVGYTGATAGKVITIQKGKNITFNEENYTIQNDGSVKKDSDGSVVVTADGKNTGNIIFVDCLTEKDYARIYFGSFDGLNESDVEKDNFGNFDMDVKGNHFDGTKTGKFLRVTAGSGSKDISCSFNFNVVNDNFDIKTADGTGINAKQNVLPEEDFEYYKNNGYDSTNKKLINIFDAEGFRKYAYIVLQTSLYGEDDEENKNPNLVIGNDDTAEYEKGQLHKGKLRKNLVYGNGYSLNFSDRNKNTNPNDSRSIISLGRVYNTTLKGSSAKQGEDKAKYKIVFEGTRFYYSNIQAVQNGVIAPDCQYMPIYIKNSTFKYANNSAIEMWELKRAGNFKYTDHYSKKDQYYIENVVIVDCVKGIESAVYDKEFVDGEFYFKGYVDVFNFQTDDELVASLSGNQLTKDYLSLDKSSPKLMDKVKNYMVDFNGKKYVNLALLTMKLEKVDANCPGRERAFYFWKENVGKYEQTTDDSSGTTKLKKEFKHTLDLTSFLPNAKFGFEAWVYADTNAFNVACQKKVVNGKIVENTNHLAWHLNRTYRDLSIISWTDDPEAICISA